ncbi:MAG: carbamate kinase [Alphaproteobacteria bacterium]|nr:carbamate kinase [Alphaproteobacteria bacterium]
MSERLVVALGGNALLRRGEAPGAEQQRRNIERAADMLAELWRDNDLTVTHGNGPQVGLLALQAEALKDVSPYPLDVLGAESEGMIGYMIEQALLSRMPGRHVATLLTQVEVDARDPAFANPTKPIGPVYDEATAQRLARERGWRIVPDGGGFRRVVASPMPLAIVELPTIKLLVQSGVLVICAGGGGIPVVRDASGALHGVPAVVDKDRASAVLARALDADALLMLTDVPAVYADWESERPRAIRRIGVPALRAMRFAAGTMEPKVEAACRFVEASGRWAAIGALQDGVAIAAGDAGTRVVADDEAASYWEG